MKSLKGTKTAENLMISFAGESQARMRYSYYAGEARKAGYVQIANIFEETADDERAHAKTFYKFLKDDFEGEAIEIKASYPVTLSDDTLVNLAAAAAGEQEEAEEMYPEFADIADEEGFEEIAYRFREISEVEERHEARFRKLIKNIEEGKVFKKDEEVEWKCNNCGYIHTGKEAPEECPACEHPRDHFEVFVETY